MYFYRYALEKKAAPQLQKKAADVNPMLNDKLENGDMDDDEYVKFLEDQGLTPEEIEELREQADEEDD